MMPFPRLVRPSGTTATLAMILALGGFAVPPEAAAGDPDDEWSLERKASDPALAAQRIAKLRRQPFDRAQWKALVRSLGAEGAYKKIEGLRKHEAADVNLMILAARAALEVGRPAEAAGLLEQAQSRAGRLEDEVFELRVAALEQAGDVRLALELYDVRLEAATATAARRALLEAAFGLAERRHQPQAALNYAKALRQLAPTDAEATLRVARTATAAKVPEEADRAYAEAIERARPRLRDELTAERARAQLDAEQPARAAELLWSLVSEPRRGTEAQRETWWDHLEEAHRRNGSADVLVGKLHKWLESTPKEAAAWRTLARAQRTAGMDPSAAWRKVAELRPRDAESRSALVDALHAKGKSAEAIAEYRNLLSRDPSEVQPGIDLANRLIASGQREEGLALAGEIEAAVGGRAPGLVLLLDFYNLNDEPDRALAVAHKLVGSSPNKPEARIALGEQLYQMNRIQDALDQWAKLPKLVRPAHRGWARHAEVLAEHGHTADAINSLKRALSAAPREPGYLRLRAVLAEEQRRPQQALQLWEQVRDYSTSPSEALLRDEARTRIVELLVGGSIPQRRLKLESSENDARAALDKGEPVAEAIEAGRFLSELYTRLENYGAAVAVQHQMLELRPDDPDRLAELARAQRRAGQVDAALHTLEELMAVQPDRKADVLAEMSELAFEAGDDEKALKTAVKAANQDRTQVDALVRLGELHERKGDIEAAAEAYRKALDTSPDSGRARLQLAELELTRGHTKRASKLFREILEHGGPPEVLKEAGRRALDLAEASGSTMELVELAVRRTSRAPEADEPRDFLLESLDRASPKNVDKWLRGNGKDRDAERERALRRPLVAALERGSIGMRLRAAQHLGRLRLPDTAVPLAKLGASLSPPRDATTTVRDAFERTRVTAIRAAGDLQDPAAVEAFARILDDTQHAMPARHAAAWALARSGSEASVDALAPHLQSGADPTLAALACLALAERPRDVARAEQARRAAELAHYVRHDYVRHACALAEASLTPDDRLDRVRDQLESSDPTLAAIAAWRLGQSERPNAKTLEALFVRFVGPPGLPRDAAGASLVELLGPNEMHPEDAGPLPPPRGHGWATVVERWLERRVAPAYRPLPVASLQPHIGAIHDALDRAARGSRAERKAVAEVKHRCETPNSVSNEHVCLAPLTEGTLAMGPAPSTTKASSKTDRRAKTRD